MSNIYENHFGTSFGINLTYDPQDPSQTTGWTTHWHSFRDYGLYPVGKPVISAPEVQKIEYEVPGRDGLYDATEALTGDVHYLNREGTFQFKQTGGRRTWDKTYYKLKNELHGTRHAIVIDEEKDGYYIGRTSVEEPRYDGKNGCAYFTIKADLEPWKKFWTKTNEKWLWDPFSFDTGFIDPYMGKTFIPEPGAANAVSWEVVGRRMPVVPNIYMYRDENYDYTQYGGDGKPHINFRYSYWDRNHEYHTKTVDLDEGNNIDKVPELVLHQDIHYTFYFEGERDNPNGRGYVSVVYRGGWM